MRFSDSMDCELVLRAVACPGEWHWAMEARLVRASAPPYILCACDRSLPLRTKQQSTTCKGLLKDSLLCTTLLYALRLSEVAQGLSVFRHLSCPEAASRCPPIYRLHTLQFRCIRAQVRTQAVPPRTQAISVFFAFFISTFIMYSGSDKVALGVA